MAKVKILDGVGGTLGRVAIGQRAGYVTLGLEMPDGIGRLAFQLDDGELVAVIAELQAARRDMGWTPKE